MGGKQTRYVGKGSGALGVAAGRRRLGGGMSYADCVGHAREKPHSPFVGNLEEKRITSRKAQEQALHMVTRHVRSAAGLGVVAAIEGHE